jgi:hypothetical protein
MSAAGRQRTCAVCGAEFGPTERTEVEAVIDGQVHYVAVHPGHSTFAPLRNNLRNRRYRRYSPLPPPLDNDEFDGYDIFDHPEAA